MKNRILIAVLTMLCFAAHALTPTYISTLNPDGTAQTNLLTFTPYPPGQPFYVYGTNIIFGATTLTYAPNASGFVSNNLEPITYTVVYSNAPTDGFFVKILDTTNYLPLTSYVTTLPVVAASFGSNFGMVTNWLNYWPATNSDPRIVLAVTNMTSLWGTNTMLVKLVTPGLSLTNSYTTNADNSVTINIGMPFQAATNSPTRITSSNPTNSYATGTIYTNGSFKSFLTGYATGAILNYTNNGTAYVLPLTNDFCVPLTTNSTFSITGGSVTNVVNWQ